MQSAGNIHLDDNFKTGKQPPKTDNKTVMMADFIDTGVLTPDEFDWDKGRSPFPKNVWGNDDYGNCVFAAEANQMLRFERAETRRTLKLTDDQVIARYKALTGCVSPGDDRDNGFVILDALRDWRAGWDLQFGTHKRQYKISAFGSIDISNSKLLDTCIYLFDGVQLGFDLPLTARAQTHNGVWDYDPNGGSLAQPGSWGGHAVWGVAYSHTGIEIITWGRRVKVTTAFCQNYMDEGWVVIDDLDSWRLTHGILKVDKLLDYFSQVGIQVRS
jgi:hypothetical protein